MAPLITIKMIYFFIKKWTLVDIINDGLKEIYWGIWGNLFRSPDINECVSNEGHGPCQDTCHNLVGGYECKCDGLPGTILSSDNHTCHESGPCSIRNAGCSHTCISTMGRVFCLCPDGFMLEDDWKTCQGEKKKKFNFLSTLK